MGALCVAASAHSLSTCSPCAVPDQAARRRAALPQAHSPHVGGAAQPRRQHLWAGGAAASGRRWVGPVGARVRRRTSGEGLGAEVPNRRGRSAGRRRSGGGRDRGRAAVAALWRRRVQTAIHPPPPLLSTGLLHCSRSPLLASMHVLCRLVLCLPRGCSSTTAPSCPPCPSTTPPSCLGEDEGPWLD